jgi:uncharacterized membrane protein
MKAFMKKQKVKKFHSCLFGVLFACLAIPFFVWGIHIIFVNNSCLDIIYPFIGMVICLSLGFYFMFSRKALIENDQMNEIS